MGEGDKMEGGRDANEERKQKDRKKTGKYNQCRGSAGGGGCMSNNTGHHWNKTVEGEGAVEAESHAVFRQEVERR